MALEVEKSPFEASLSAKAKCYRRWNYPELEMDYPELVSKVCQSLAVKGGEPLPKRTEDEELIRAEGTGCVFPSISQRTQKHDKMPSMPSNKFDKIKVKAEYVERQPLVSRTSCGSGTAHSFRRRGLYLEEQQRNAGEGSDTTELLQGLLELPAKAVDSTLYNSTAKSLHHLDVDCRSQMTVTPYSSTPKHLAGKRNPHFDAVTPVFPSTTLQPPEDSDFDWQGMMRSQRSLGAGALSSLEISAPGYLSDPAENHMLRRDKQIAVDSCPTVGHTIKMSPFQADYWACAIPDSLPPSPDRQSPHWNPNKEYEDLLDYTYPLRPKYKLAKNPKDSSVHDSGVDLDSLSISPESTLKSLNVQGQELQAMGIQNAERFRIPLLKNLKCSGVVPHYKLSPVGKAALMDGVPASGSADISGEIAHGLSPPHSGPGPFTSASLDERDWNMREPASLTNKDAASYKFIRSTKVLPLQKGSSNDEEYLSLPPRLKELESLAQQMADLSLTIRKPDLSPCIGVNGEQFPLEVQEDGGANKSQWEIYCDSCQACSLQEHGEEDLLSNQGCWDHEGMPKETASIDLLKTRCLDFLESGRHHVEQQGDHYRDSLALHIKTFCCQLEELICWLHKVAEVTDNWIPPKPDIESVKAALQRYLEFKKDLAGHQALTESVLQDGERLLKCMTSNSPVLRNTLGLIAKQSVELEGRAERLYRSLLAAMDTLGDGLIKNCDAQQTAPHAEFSREFHNLSLSE